MKSLLKDKNKYFTCNNCVYCLIEGGVQKCTLKGKKKVFRNPFNNTCVRFSMHYIRLASILKKKFYREIIFNEIVNEDKFEKWGNRGNRDGSYTPSINRSRQAVIRHGDAFFIQNFMVLLHEIGHHIDPFIKYKQPEYCEEYKAEYWKLRVLKEYKIPKNIIKRERIKATKYMKQFNKEKACYTCKKKCRYLGINILKKVLFLFTL